MAEHRANAAAPQWPVREGTFPLGDFRVAGGVIRDARLAWQSHGTLGPDRDNVVVFPCGFAATHHDQAALVGPDGVLDPRRWFVVIPDAFSGGLSSSASDSPDHPPLVTVRDNVRAQYRLLLERFGVRRIAAVYGSSMGAAQAYQWAAAHPEKVDRAIVVCGSARTSEHNRVVLSGLLRVLEAAPEHLGGGRFSAEPLAALRAVAHVRAAWGLSQDFYREGLHLTALGAPDLEAFLRTEWEEAAAGRRAADLYAQLLTWYHADISDDPRYGGDLASALSAIRARVLLLPSESDLYFRVADNAADLPHLADADLRVIPSAWGHRAGSPPAGSEDLAFLRDAVREWLDR